MEEKKLNEEKFGKPIDLKDFKDYLEKTRVNPYEQFDKGVLSLVSYQGVKRFKSIRRAIRRGHVSIYGEIYPKRPFKNTKNNKLKRNIYAQLRHRSTVA